MDELPKNTDKQNYIVFENKHEATFNLIIKKVFGSTFGTNIYCYHGKKFENVVTLMYELIPGFNFFVIHTTLNLLNRCI